MISLLVRGLKPLAAALLLLLLPACAWSPFATDPEAPAEARRHMVATAHPLATRAGLDILRRGGSAIDAAIAAELVLTLVEPQSSGIGGGAFLLHYDRPARQVDAYDGRETAPAAIAPDVFLDADGKPRDFFDAVVGGASVGVPGFLRMAEQAHDDHGRLPWAWLFRPAIELAENGFPVTPRLHRLIAEDPHLATFGPAADYFHGADGAPPPVGTILRNPALADTLRTIARDGADAFYEGEIARDIVAAVRAAPRNPGALSVADMAAYRPVARKTLCRPYRIWRVCVMPPPTSGGTTVLQMLGMLSHFDLAALGPDAPESWHLFAEAGRLAFADRNAYIADPDFVDVPVEGLLDDAYLAERAALIDPGRALPEVGPGTPPGTAHAAATGHAPEKPSTTHLVVVDGVGNAVSMTASVENAFGSRLLVRGFILNNQLTDFSFRPEVDGRPVANRVEPGKRPRSSMAPAVVFDRKGEFRLATGSPGGPNIIAYVAKSLIATLDWGLDVQRAAALPNLSSRGGPVRLEEGAELAALAAALRARGHEVVVEPLVSGIHSVERRDGVLFGGADPRREGVARGD